MSTVCFGRRGLRYSYQWTHSRWKRLRYTEWRGRLSQYSTSGVDEAYAIGNFPDHPPCPPHGASSNKQAQTSPAPWENLPTITSWDPIVTHTLYCLNPKRLQASDYVELSGKICKLRHPNFLSPISPLELAYAKTHTLVDRQFSSQSVPFPDGTSGFFYWYSVLGMPPPARELRFRITESSDPRSFARGQDLLWRWGLPWSIPLLAICGSRAFGIIKDTLLTSQQLTNELVESCKGMLRMNWPGKVGARSRIIYSLGQKFYAELHRSNERLWFLAHDLQDLKLDDIFADWRDPKHWPYAGSALWCFERSRLPEHRKKRIIVLRCLQIIEPIRKVTPDYDGYVAEPTPGALFTVGGQPYMINMDPPSAMAKVVKRLLIQRQIANAVVSKVKAQNQKKYEKQSKAMHGKS